MNFLESIESIKKILDNAGKSHFSAQILDLQLSGGTGGEVLISVCSKLLDIKELDNATYQLIKEESEKLIKYAKSIGLYPHSTLWG